MRVSFTVLGHEIFCFNIERDEDAEWVDWEDLREEFDSDDDEDEEEYEDEEEEEDEEPLVTLRWGEPCNFERNIFVP